MADAADNNLEVFDDRATRVYQDTSPAKTLKTLIPNSHLFITEPTSSYEKTRRELLYRAMETNFGPQK